MYKMDQQSLLQLMEAIEVLIRTTDNDILRMALQDEYKKLHDEYTKLVVQKKEKEKQQPKQPRYIVT
jgi:hypothetical protein